MLLNIPSKERNVKNTSVQRRSSEIPKDLKKQRTQLKVAVLWNHICQREKHQCISSSLMLFQVVKAVKKQTSMSQHLEPWYFESATAGAKFQWSCMWFSSLYNALQMFCCSEFKLGLVSEIEVRIIAQYWLTPRFQVHFYPQMYEMAWERWSEHVAEAIASFCLCLYISLNANDVQLTTLTFFQGSSCTCSLLDLVSLLLLAYISY